MTAVSSAKVATGRTLGSVSESLCKGMSCVYKLYSVGPNTLPYTCSDFFCLGGQPVLYNFKGTLVGEAFYYQIELRT